MTAPYTFRFYRTITNSEGRLYDCTVETITIQRAKSADRAREAAIQRFSRHQKLRSWDCLASGCEQLDEIAKAS